MSEPDLAFVEKLARDVGAIIKDDGKKAKTVRSKMSVSDVVTATDVAVENMIKERLATAFPQHKFFGEETGGADAVLTEDPTWVVDPVDGTMNFVHTFPLHTTSIAFMRNKRTQLAVIYCPGTDEMFTASRGGGAFLNGERLICSHRTDLEDALVSTGFHVGLQKKIRNARANHEPAFKDPRYDQFLKIMLDNTKFIIDNCADLRRTGAASVDLAYVAAGRIDAYAEIGPHEWDFAAGILLIEEAGGHIMSFENRPFDISGRHIVCAGTEELAAKLSRSLKASPLHPSEM